MQRFSTTRYLFSIQLLWKPKIIIAGDKQTKFEWSKGYLTSRVMQMSYNTSAIEQTHWFASFFKMLVDESLRDTRGFKAIDYAFLAPFTPAFWELFFLRIKVEGRGLLWSRWYEKASVKVSILCLWTDNLHLVTCSKREFLNLCHCSRSALEKICEIYTYDRRPHGWPDQKSILACADAKKRESENNQTIFETCLLNPSHERNCE